MLSSFLKRLLLARQADFGPEIKILDLNYSLAPLIERIALQSALKKKFGKKGLQIIYDSGRQFSISIIKQLKDKFGLNGEELEKIYFSLVQTCGFGDIKVIELKKAKGIFHAESLVAKHYLAQGVQKEPVDFHLAGMLAGFIQAATGKKVSCKETACIAQGKTICEFIVK